jgi:hypothetical protein
LLDINIFHDFFLLLYEKIRPAGRNNVLHVV